MTTVKHNHDALLHRVMDELPDDELLCDLSDLFELFVDTTRMKILYALQESELCVCANAELIHMTQSAVSHQLKVLKDGNLVGDRREGKTIRRTVLLTGDMAAAGEAVAGELGVSEVHAGLLPNEKVDAVEELLATSHGLVFTGDGINDAPVLFRVDVGVAMGALGSDAAIEAANVVLMDDKPTKIALAVEISRKTMRIVKQNIVLAFVVKLVVLLLGALGVAGIWFAVFADVGVLILAAANALRAMHIGSGK